MGHRRRRTCSESTQTGNKQAANRQLSPGNVRHHACMVGGAVYLVAVDRAVVVADRLVKLDAAPEVALLFVCADELQHSEAVVSLDRHQLANVTVGRRQPLDLRLYARSTDTDER